MNNLIWLLRASKWARNPPRARTVKMIVAIIAVGFVIAGLERLELWPDWARLNEDRAPRASR
ncbi:hypothetical protein EYF88_08710 [Paracoccus sediminis]|uniref:Uncharacterized protein n=1 Tax=Paracoccus sediminis TaxID=1214787 RepID=A0A238WBJ8_9RHOB|nr:hypothetical protein EYF88_08710 [Paracoccus sediminis]SNR43751.1 hypothetical protein SAMN06265378_10439 [Paracoccus sediminis]